MIIGELVTTFVGWIYLKFRYRNPDKIREVLDREYNGLYSAAGTVYFLNVVAGLGALFMVIVVVLLIVKIVYNLIIN